MSARGLLANDATAAEPSYGRWLVGPQSPASGHSHRATRRARDSSWSTPTLSEIHSRLPIQPSIQLPSELYCTHPHLAAISISSAKLANGFYEYLVYGCSRRTRRHRSSEGVIRYAFSQLRVDCLALPSRSRSSDLVVVDALPRSWDPLCPS